MSAYLVTYDLVGTDATSDNYKRLIRALEEAGARRVQESVWVVASNATVTGLRDSIARYMHSSDRLFVVKSAVLAAWQNPMCSADWLAGTLKNNP
jgi:CRISPR-associated endonuclease Cas2